QPGDPEIRTVRERVVRGPIAEEGIVLCHGGRGHQHHPSANAEKKQCASADARVGAGQNFPDARKIPFAICPAGSRDANSSRVALESSAQSWPNSFRSFSTSFRSASSWTVCRWSAARVAHDNTHRTMSRMPTSVLVTSGFLGGVPAERKTRAARQGAEFLRPSAASARIEGGVPLENSGVLPLVASHGSFL